MKIRNIFKRKIVNETSDSTSIDENAIEDILLKAIMNGEEIDRKDALTIPSVSSAVGLICDAFAMVPFKLYQEIIKDGKRETKEVDDKRVNIINNDTKDTLDGFQFKKAICEDYLLGKGGYAYINKNRK